MPKEYRLGYGFLGNGTTVWNRAEEVNGDYKTIAHIEDDGSLTLYENELLADILESLKRAAAQDAYQYQQNLFPIREKVGVSVAKGGNDE